MLAGVLLFTAQAAGVEFDLASQVTILLVGLILSEGSAGIPGGGIVVAHRAHAVLKCARPNFNHVGAITHAPDAFFKKNTLSGLWLK